ncbi:uncharacterized protein LOC123878123 isoform X2 [Maniola jurtina]|uniref:uncharacterized protein LOC123878123 isoform X2 n=1 Tax=Maniola jurtina TaxID=191418 RepID=UPI001E68AF81|nr:uncharacterized protein LOC123878123 isoform X2 [Maniola jurtina]
MLAVLVLSVSLSILGSHATINEMVAARQQIIPQNVIPPNVVPPLNFNTDDKGTPNNPINEMVAAGQQTIPQNFIPPLNFITDGLRQTPNNPLPIQLQVVDNLQNGAGCPNTAMLLNILNLLASSLPQDDKTILDPEKFKYVLTVVKNVLKTTPLNPENLVLYDKLKNLDALVNKINAPVQNPSLRELDGTTSLPPYDLPGQRNYNCQVLFNNLINFINTAYFQVLGYCLQTGKCNPNNELNIPSNYNSIYQLTPYGLIQRNSTMNIWPVHENIPKESITAGADLVNFIKSQEGKGTHDMMFILKNYRPSGASNVPVNEFKSPNDMQNSLIYMNPKSNQIPSLYQPMNEMNGKNPNLQPSNIYYPPNVNTLLWRTIFSGLKGLPGNTYPKDNQKPSLYQPSNEMNGINPNLQPTNIYYPPNMNTGLWQTIFYGLKRLPRNTYPLNNLILSLYQPINEMNGKNPNTKPINIFYPPNMNTVPWQTIFSGLKGMSGNTNIQLLTKFNKENNLGTISSIYPGMETLLQPINGQIIPINTRILNINPNEMVKPNPSVNKNPNILIDILKQAPNQQQNLLSTNMKITQAEINKIPNFVDNNPLLNIQQYLQHSQSPNIQPSIPQNIFLQKPKLPQQSNSYIAYNQNQILNPPMVGVDNQLLNQNGLGFNQISPYITVYDGKDNNGQNMFTDNTKQGNYGGQSIDFNYLLGVANQGKLNSVPIKNSIVELTYALKRPTPVYESQYYVKYRLPYQTFLSNLQNLLAKKPNLRSEPNTPHQELLVGSNVTDASKDLKGLNYEDIVKLTSTNGTLITAKVLENNDTRADEILKVVQKLNSKLPVESIINFNKNATKRINLETQQDNVNGTKTFGVNNLSESVYPTHSDVQRRIYTNLNYPYTSIGQYPQKLQHSPYSAYQTNPGLLNVGMPFLKYRNVLPNTNNLNNPTLYLQYLARNYPQLGR